MEGSREGGAREKCVNVCVCVRACHSNVWIVNHTTVSVLRTFAWAPSVLWEQRVQTHCAFSWLPLVRLESACAAASRTSVLSLPRSWTTGLMPSAGAHKGQTLSEQTAAGQQVHRRATASVGVITLDVRRQMHRLHRKSIFGMNHIPRCLKVSLLAEFLLITATA